MHPTPIEDNAIQQDSRHSDKDEHSAAYQMGKGIPGNVKVSLITKET